MTLLNRKCSYYAVCNIPKINRNYFNGKKQIWISLHTKDRTIAEQRYYMLMCKLNSSLKLYVMDKIMNRLYASPNPFNISILNKLQSFSDDNNYDYNKDEANAVVLQWLLGIIEIEKNKTGVAFIADSFLEQLNYLKSEYIQNNFSSIENEVISYLDSENFPKPSDKTKLILFEMFMRAKIQFCDYMAKYINGEDVVIPNELIKGVSNIQGLPNFDYFNFSSSKVVPLQKFVQPNKVSVHKYAKTFLEIIEEYNSQTDVIKSKEACSKRLSHAKIINELFNNKPFLDVTDDEFQEMLKNLPYIHKNISKINNYKISEIIKKGKKEPENCIKEKTLDEYITCIKTVYTYLVDQKIIKSEDNPISKYKKNWPSSVNTEGRVKHQPFTINQLNALFHSPLYTGCENDENGYFKIGNSHPRRMRFWVPLISLFTGARLNEICQLRVNDICYEKEGNLYYFNFTEKELGENNQFDVKAKSIKTSAGIRKTPIHKELIKIGFLDYVDDLKNKGEKLLFPEALLSLKYNKNRGKDVSLSSPTGQWFGRFLKKVDKTIKDESYKLNASHCFHSFRHTVRTEFRRNRADIKDVEDICGWETEEKGRRKDEATFADYYGEKVLKRLKETLDKNLIYEGLNLSHLYKH